GEGATLLFDEKLEILRTCVAATRGRGSLVSAISALTTPEAVALAKAAADQGCDGLMVLPPYVALVDIRRQHHQAVAALISGGFGQRHCLRRGQRRNRRDQRSTAARGSYAGSQDFQFLVK